MKKYLGLAFAAALGFGTSVYAQSYPSNSNARSQSSPNANSNSNKNYGSHETVQDTKTKTDSGTKKTSTDMVFGKVEEYQPGQSIKITTPGKTEGSRTIDLNGNNLTAKVASGVKVGDWVSIAEKTDNSGHKTVTVKHSKTASREQQPRDQQMQEQEPQK